MKYPNLEDKKWLERSLAEKSMPKIAKEEGCSYSAVYHAVISHGIDLAGIRGGNTHNVNNTLRSGVEQSLLIHRDDINALFLSGSSVPYIADRFGVEYTTLLPILKKWGIYKGRPASSNKKRALDSVKDKCIETYQEYPNIASLADKYGVSYKATRDALIAWGVYHPVAVRGGEGKRKHRWNKTSGGQARNWRGGKIAFGNGGQYIGVYIPTHPCATSSGYVAEHRLVIEGHLGRYLTRKEIVHHKNGVKTDNRLENLELVSDRGAHTRDHFERSHREGEAQERIRNLEALLRQNGIDPNQPSAL